VLIRPDSITYDNDNNYNYNNNSNNNYCYYYYYYCYYSATYPNVNPILCGRSYRPHYESCTSVCLSVLLFHTGY